MTRVTFGVVPSSFITNMCVKQNSLDHYDKYPLATKAVNDSFYVDDGLTGTDTVDGVNTICNGSYNPCSLLQGFS